MYGALNNIPIEVMEAARIDGAGPRATALPSQLPHAAQVDRLHGGAVARRGTQLFVEPTCCRRPATRVVPNDYSLNQLAYQYAFTSERPQRVGGDLGAAPADRRPRVVRRVRVSVAGCSRRSRRDGGDHVRPRAAHAARRGLAASCGLERRTIGCVVLVVFMLFFVIPVVWLLIAVTKSGGELVRHAPFRPGSVGSLRGQLARAVRLPGRRDPAVVPELGLLLRRGTGAHAGRYPSRPATPWP